MLRAERSHRSSSWGGALADAVIVLPVLLTMAAGMVMIGTRISDYMYLNQSARELGLILSRTPGMSWLTDSDQTYTGSVTFWTPSEGVLQQTAESCLTEMRDSQGQCSGAHGCSVCAELVSKWYAAQFVDLKKLLRKADVHVAISYGRGEVAEGATDSSGLCLIKVVLSAETTALPMMGSGQIGVSATVPYLSTPMNWNGGDCRPISQVSMNP
jgi:hypothetical protein